MNANSLWEWLSLGGHGVYVWPSLALCLLTVALECLVLRQARRRALARIRRLHRSPRERASS